MKNHYYIADDLECFARTLLEISLRGPNETWCPSKPRMEDFDTAVKISMHSFSEMGIDISGIDGEKIKRKLQTEIVFTISTN